MSSSQARAVEVLRVTVAQLAARVEALEQRQSSRPLRRADLAIMTRLLPVLGAVYGSEGFTSRDCVEDDAPGLRLVLGPMSSKSVGKLLARADGIVIDNLMVRRQRMEFGVVIWRVFAC